MAVYVDTYRCHACDASKEVVHNGKPTLRDFSNSELLPDNEIKVGKGEAKKLICFDCESERMSDVEE